MSREDSHEYRELLIRQLEKFRAEKGISQRELSLSLGQTEGYISKLTNPKTHKLPRMINFFYICDYFGVHPKDFFDEGIEHSGQISALVDDLYNLSESQLEHVHAIVRDLARQPKDK